MFSKPVKIEFGYRGEDIFYSMQDGRSILFGFTWANGARIYPSSIKKWGGINEDITSEEKKEILKDVIAFVGQGREKPIVNINSDDFEKELWEGVCKSESSSIQCVEYTSNKKQAGIEREMFLSVLKAGKELTIDGRKIKNEKGLDDYLKERNSAALTSS
jgi:hypothetical protein